jgi:hypothetical protein
MTIGLDTATTLDNGIDNKDIWVKNKLLRSQDRSSTPFV